ncbi:MAG: helix-turn-helix transcriptional regulator [Candidatus Hydrogenedentes bacterium]|nr:helix-turn-helix transcriptional regulator [Candidatus Hydrogenedentota bacterium]
MPRWGYEARLSDANAILDGLDRRDRRMRAMVRQASVNLHIAQLIYTARTEAGLTQAELARHVGTTQSVIARLEDADYQGHSLLMLQRIATALNLQVEVRFIRRRAPATRTR